MIFEDLALKIADLLVPSAEAGPKDFIHSIRYLKEPPIGEVSSASSRLIGSAITLPGEKSPVYIKNIVKLSDRMRGVHAVRESGEPVYFAINKDAIHHLTQRIGGEHYEKAFQRASMDEKIQQALKSYKYARNRKIPQEQLSDLWSYTKDVEEMNKLIQKYFGRSTEPRAIVRDITSGNIFVMPYSKAEIVQQQGLIKILKRIDPNE